MKQALKKAALVAACAAGMAATMQVEAANWLMLQGTEPSSTAGRVKVWGFVQAQYQKDYSDISSGGPAGPGYIPPKLIGPQLDNQSGFNVNRARVGFRGVGMPIDPKVNYFFLLGGGNNGINAANGGAANVSDASITLNHIKGARVRVGMFKTPIGEEALQAIHVFDYVNFTTVTNQLMLERLPAFGDGNTPPSDIPEANMNAHSTPVGAFRDVGVQVFDTFKQGSWEHSYAIMTGNGNGLNFGDNDGSRDTYLYWSSENVYGGKGPRRQGLKMYAWGLKGTRIDTRTGGTTEQDRKRSGLGVKYLKGAYRVTAEYMKGEGMIFQGQHRPAHSFNDLKASGYYLDLGWYIPKSNWELDLRYDMYTREENHPSSVKGTDESDFKTITIGTQYHFNKKTRLNIDYAKRDFSSDTAAVETQLEGVKGRLAMQVTHIF